VLRSPIQTPDQEGFTRDWCRLIKEDGATTIMTGGLRSYGLVEEVTMAGETDFIGLCRPLICEPDLIQRWKKGDRTKSACTSCNRCAIASSKGLPLACYRDKKGE
jgi:2,4-dienoyl-CoA reductase-like NADH-dependent reductase (Old Yellow Enzyme family)